MTTRLTVPDWVRQGAARARLASSAMQQRLSRVTYPSRPAELGGPLLPHDTTAWQGIVRTSQTPAFSAALVAALSVAWIGTATLSGSSDRQTPPPEDGQPDGPSISVVEPASSTNPPVIAAPPDAEQLKESNDFSQNYAKIAAELDQQASRGELSVYANTAPPPSLCPQCANPLLPGPDQTTNVPQAPAADPNAPPVPTSVDEPSPPTTTATSNQPVPPATTQPTTELPATAQPTVSVATPQPPAPPATTQPPAEQPATTQPPAEQPATTTQPAPAATTQPSAQQPVSIQPTAEQGSGQVVAPAN